MLAGVVSRLVEAPIPPEAVRLLRHSAERLAERFAAERLAAIRSAGRDRTGAAPEVLFVCVHNAGRSQMAAALLAHYEALGRHDSVYEPRLNSGRHLTGARAPAGGRCGGCVAGQCRRLRVPSARADRGHDRPGLSIA